MALNLPAAGDAGNRMPIVKYDSRAGRIFRVDRSNDSGQWESDPIEITPVFQAIFDMENIEIGWLHFPTGGMPDLRMVRHDQPMPDRPSDKHRAGFRVNMVLGKQAGGDVREMAANAQVAIKGMDALHDAYLAAVGQNPGMLPIVRLAGATPVTTQGKGANGQPVSSTNYQPSWEIVKWVPRPADLSAEALAGKPIPPAPGPARGPDHMYAGAPPLNGGTPPQQQAAPPAPPPPPPAPPPPQAPASVDEDF